MDLVATLVSSGIGLVSGLATAYAAMRFKLREERSKREEERKELMRTLYLDAAKKDRILRAPDSTSPSLIKASTNARIQAEQVAQYVLVIRPPGSTDHEKFFLMPETRLLVGRDSAVDLVVPDPLISGRHCFFETKDGQLFVEDLMSAQGTIVNDRRVARALLINGDVIKIADTRITVATIGER